MTKDKPSSPGFHEPRRQAEEGFAAKSPKTNQPQGVVEKLLHELQVQQIELKLQNEVLRSALEQLEESRSKYSDLYDFAPVGYLTLDEKAFILDANLTASRQIGIDRGNLINTPFPIHLSRSDGDLFRLHLDKVFRSMELQVSEVELRPKDGGELPVLLESIFVQDVHGKSSCRTSVIDITGRKRAEEALRESEKRYRELVQNANSAIIRWKSDGTLTFVNEYAQAFFGYEEKEIVGRHVNMLVPETGSNGLDLSTLVQDIVDHPEQHLGNINENVCRDGRRVWMAWTNKPVFDVNGEVIEILAVGTDITERKRMEEEVCRARDDLEIRVQEHTAELGKTMETLRSERQRFNDVLDALPVYVVLLTPDYRVPFANVVFRERFGESRGLRCFEHLFGRSEPCEVCDSFKVLKTMTPHQWEWTGPDSRDYSVFDFPFTDTDGSTLILEMGIDITERKRAEEQLLQASQYARSLIEASLDPLVTISPEGKITDTNDATIRVTGVVREMLIGSDFSDYFTGPEKAREIYRQVFEKGFVTDYPLTIRHKDGSLVEVLYNASVYKDARGNVLGVLAAARDITERKNIEQQLARADRLSSLGMLAGGIAHEIRNPLAGINLFIDFLNDEEKFSRTGQEQSIFEEMKVNIKKIDHIIKRVLDFSRLSGTASRSKLQLSQLIHDSIQLWRSRITRDGLEVRESCGENLSEVLGDSIEIQQVLNNLIQNALEAMERGGALTISVENGTLSFDRKHAAVIIRVQDSGPGIPFDQQKNIFNPFFTTKSTGTGLGLAISHRIVVSHGGGISFESVPDVGTTFIVELPVAPRG